MTLERYATEYLKLQRSLGFKLEQAEPFLRSFVAFMVKRRKRIITTPLALEWAQAPTSTSVSWQARRLEAVRGFARYLLASEPRTEVPAPGLLARRRRRENPYIYTAEDVAALMREARLVATSLGAATYSTMIGLLAATGMRVGEALHLDRRDVDLEQAVLLVRESKFRRTRRVPIHETTAAALAEYARVRDRLVPCPRSSSFFAGRSGVRLLHVNVCGMFREIATAAGLEARGTRPPRLHDLRHTFAVQTVRHWYRHGLQVESRIPWLSTYLGHVGASSTYWYLTATPDLMAMAAKMMERAWKVSR